MLASSSDASTALGGFCIPVEDQQLFGPHWDHGVRLSLLIGEFHQKRPFAVPFELLDHSANLPAQIGRASCRERV